MSMPLLVLDGSVSLVGRTRGLFQDVVVAFDSFQPCEHPGHTCSVLLSFQAPYGCTGVKVGRVAQWPRAGSASSAAVRWRYSPG